jgi:hypothetical protein
MKENQWPVGEETQTTFINGIPIGNILFFLIILSISIIVITLYIVWKKRK